MEFSPDEWACQLLAALEEHQPRRLSVDAFSDLLPLFSIPERQAFLGPALANRLRDQRVTATINSEIDACAGLALTIPVQNLSAPMDNVILLRTVELRSLLRRMLSILKQRQTRFDSTIREFTIGPDGIVVGEPFDADALLTGSSEPLPVAG